MCSDARQLVASKLPSSWEEASSMVSVATVLDDLQSMMLHDLIFPFFASKLSHEAPRVFAASTKPSREAIVFANALRESSPETFQTCKEQVTGMKFLQEEQRLQRAAIADAWRRLFVRFNEAGLRELSARLGRKAWVAERAFRDDESTEQPL